MNLTQPINEIKVSLDFGETALPVGRLAIRDRVIYFEYLPSFIETGLALSPYRLPTEPGLVTLPPTPFEGLAGVFNDSLPDGWGRLLFDRLLRSQGVLPATVSPLDRLAYVGTQGLGALVYEPDHSDEDPQNTALNLDHFASQAQQVLEGSADDVLEELLALNGSSAGARPKALISVDATREHIRHGGHQQNGFEPWIVKFANTQDGPDAGAIEYVYALMAKEAGIDMPDVHLFPSNDSAGYFAIKRFDRIGDQRFHMHTACGLLHSDFRTPALDYEDIIALTGGLTRDVREIEKMYRLAIFNVLAHNRDDHGKNFSYLMDHTGQWKLSPAYDLTFSSGPQGHQSTMVMGEGKSPTIAHLVKLGLEAKIKQSRIDEFIDQTMSALAQWPALAREHGVSKSNIALISDKILLRAEK